MDLIKEVHQYLSKEIDEVNELILKTLSAEEELVLLVGNHIARSGGKRIRPMLTLLSANMFDYNDIVGVQLATSVELIHMATLLHDDVVDGSKMRRFLPAANIIWGSKASILVGDFLFSQSFKLMVATGSIDALTSLSSAAAIIAEGEVAQLARLESRELISAEEYLKIAGAKTATLFGAACEIGAIIANQSINYRKALKDFGLKLGMIFQITDDLLDYISDTKITGKITGDDFAEGKVTLPLIILAQKLLSEQRAELLRMLSANDRNTEEFAWVINLIREHKIADEILNYLQILKSEADRSLSVIGINNRCKEYLRLLIDFAINRSY